MGELFIPTKLYRSSDPEMRILGTEGTLRVWRCLRQGPPYITLTGSTRPPVRYIGADLNAWISSRRVVPPKAA